MADIEKINITFRLLLTGEELRIIGLALSQRKPLRGEDLKAALDLNGKLLKVRAAALREALAHMEASIGINEEQQKLAGKEPEDIPKENS